jgi:hypothetical protein
MQRGPETIIETNHTAAEAKHGVQLPWTGRLGPVKICRRYSCVMHNEPPTRSAWRGRLDHRGGRIGAQ